MLNMPSGYVELCSWGWGGDDVVGGGSQSSILIAGIFLNKISD
jgi:hypothetical protein